MIILVENDIPRFQIAMNHTSRMRMRNGFGDVDQHFGSFLRQHWVISQNFKQALTLDKRHRKKRLTVVLADFINRYDTRMVEASGRFGFGLKSNNFFLRGKRRTFDHLQRDNTVKLRLSRLEHNAHTASRDLANDLVVSDPLLR